jgi:hypothetical protein
MNGHKKNSPWEEALWEWFEAYEGLLEEFDDGPVLKFVPEEGLLYLL